MTRFLLAALALLTAYPSFATPRVYANPIIDADFPDPTVIKARDGYFYVYATQSAGEGATVRNVQVARSLDLVHWTMLGDALPAKPAWASRTQDFWAPDVIEDHGRYILYYSAKPDAALTDSKQGLCLAVAVSSRPEGPFTDIGHPLQCGPGFENIDPMAFDDPATGKKLLYWGSGFGPIKIQELSSDRLSFRSGSLPKPLLYPVKSDDNGEYRRLEEGAWVARHGGYYYLFTSGDNCCGPNAHYGVMVARSRSAHGPFRIRSTTAYLVVAGGGRWIAPGHNSLIRDGHGADWMLYHGVDRARQRSHPGDEINTRRVLLLDPIVWHDEWPEVAGNRPSERVQPAPVTGKIK